MKDFSKLTNEEVYNLTPEEISLYKKLALAQEGVKFPVEPKKPETEKVEPDVMVYTIDGISDKWGGLCFESFEDARDFALFLKKAKGICYQRNDGSYDYSTKYIQKGLPLDWHGKEPSLNISSETIFSKEKFENAKNRIKEYNKAMESYNKEHEKYKKSLAEANEFTNFIDEKVEAVVEDFNRKKRLTLLFVYDYLPVAENNESIAMNFLEKAYNVSEDDKKYILEHKDDKSIRS
jgi:hypothetical protein